MRSLSLLLWVAITLVGCGRSPRETRAPMPGPTPTPNTNGIQYHGGRVLTSPTGPNLYYIWYGNWSGNTGPAILTDLANNIGGSAYFNIITSYYGSSNVTVTNAVNFVGSTNDAYSQGTAPSVAQIRMIVSSAIAGGLAKDTNGVYMVLTSEDVAPSSFCKGLCGGWSHFSMDGSDIKYAWVGNPARCPTRCAPAQPTTGPNGNLGVDAMAATLVHEFINSVTDSDGDGWYDSSGKAPASICGTPQLAFPNAYVTSNGALATVRLGPRDYFLTSNWVNANGGYCALSYPRTTTLNRNRHR